MLMLHGIDFFAPAVFVGVTVPLLANLLGWKNTRPMALGRTMGWACVLSALVLVAGLVISGHDGKMATYGAMVLACAVVCWWRSA